jgi:citrate lyase subunit beta/citryl-CoA lyase
VILDLEDSVAPEAKDAARAQAAAALKAGGFGEREVAVRINALDSSWADADLAAILPAGPAAIVIPKVSTPANLSDLAKRLAAAHGTVRVWAMMETPLAVLNAGAIAAAGHDPTTRLDALIIGTNDLVKETRAELDSERTAALYWLSAILTAGRAYGLDVIDGVYNDIKNRDGLRREAEQGRRLGMDGKTIIHPDQIAIANDAFSPTRNEITAAEAIVAAFDLPENRGKGVISLAGRMVERLHRDMALRTLALAEAVQRRSTT